MRAAAEWLRAALLVEADAGRLAPWVAEAKNALIEVSYSEAEVDEVSALQRQAYNEFRRGNYLMSMVWIF